MLEGDAGKVSASFCMCLVFNVNIYAVICTKVAAKVRRECTDVEERQVAKFMTHSVDVPRTSYQHLATTEQAVSVYSSLNRQSDEKQPPMKRRKFSADRARAFPPKRRKVPRKALPTHSRQSKNNA